ncbi:SDR family NAD(P)-dependent oxidoreductase [Chloroflexota bacterium]
MYSLDGKVALVTGAASKPGFGHAIAVRLAQEGADIVVVDKDLPPDGLSEDDLIEGWKGIVSVVEEVEALGRKALAIKTDITDSQQVKDMVTNAVGKFGKLDILVNNAGIMEEFTPIIEFDEQVWRKILAVNLNGNFHCSKHVAKSMVERGGGGKIINLSSQVGRTGAAQLGAYVSSKFGIVGLTQTLAHELAPHKINVNAICPGAAPTNLSPSMGGSGRTQARLQGVSVDEANTQSYGWLLPMIPWGRMCTPNDIANVAAFLASSESDYLTGLAISVTGGALMP